MTLALDATDLEKYFVSFQDIIHASDCDIKFSLKRIKAKITDFSLRGMIRVVLKVSQWPQDCDGDSSSSG